MTNYKPRNQIRIELKEEHAERIRARAIKNNRRIYEQARHELEEYERGLAV